MIFQTALAQFMRVEIRFEYAEANHPDGLWLTDHYSPLEGVVFAVTWIITPVLLRNLDIFCFDIFL